MFLKNKLIKNNILFAFIMSCMLLLPDFIINLFWKNYYLLTSKNTIKEIIITFFITFMISFLNKKQKIIFFSLFLILVFIQVLNFVYFRSYLMPYQIGLIFSEYKDILDSLSSIKIEILLVFIIINIYFLILYLLNKKLEFITYKLMIFVLIIILSVFPFLMAKKKVIYVPNSTHFSYLNTLFGINLFLIDKFSPKTNKIYKQYIVKKINSGKPIVIMIMGESLNYKRMHLFGWDVNDTPRLDYLAKNDKNFIYKPAISGGVNTPVSLVTFFNLKREPDNTKLLFSQKTNIIKLAKDNNYHVYWLSMQDEGTSISTIFNNADIKKTKKDYNSKYDDILLKNLRNIDFSKKTFVILHFRANHSPYEEYTPKQFYKWNFNYKNYHNYKIYSYYDSVLYIDSLLFDIIDYMKNNHKNYIIYFTSDHAEMLGFKDENGKYGHSQLVWGDSYVPFIYYSDKYHKKLDKVIYNHYLISKILVRDLGYKIINPNENGKYYINNVQIDGSAGWIEYNLSKKGIK